jgi:signal transduction histidine kinase
MDAASARRLLRGGNHRERLAAARALIGHALPSDRHLISNVAKREDDQYVRAALLRLLVSLPAHDGDIGRPLGPQKDPEPDDLKSGLIRLLTDQLTHEVATVVSTLKSYARRENDNYTGSQTEREIERLEHVLSAMRDLGDAASPAHWEQFDLSRFVGGVVQDERLVHHYDLLFAEGDRPHEVIASKGLIALFVRNAVANAIEATRSLHGDPRPVIVTWGTDDRDHWLAVLDDGPGVARIQAELEEIGTSTKDGHPGMGLAIASQVATSLQGRLVLRTQERGGAICRLDWPTGQGNV